MSSAAAGRSAPAALRRKVDSASFVEKDLESTSNHRSEPAFMRPSMLLQLRSMSTTQRLAALASRTVLQRDPHASNIQIVGDAPPDFPVSLNTNYAVPSDVPLFNVSPPEIVLQNVIPFHSYEVALHFRNDDQYPRRLRLQPIEEPHFELKGWKSDSLYSGRVAPGMETAFILHFKPDENRDLETSIVCETERERFLVPVRIVGPRALFDFPDEIHFDEVPVRYTTSKTILVRNVGTKDGYFAVQAPADSAFQFEPARGYVPKGATSFITVHFTPTRVDAYSDDIRVTYSGDQDQDVSGLVSGSEDVSFLRMHGSADNVDVRLEHGQVTMAPTYISLSSFKTITIHNHSDIIAKYQWKQFSTDVEEVKFKERQKRLLLVGDPAQPPPIMADMDQDGPAQCASGFLLQAQQRAIDEDPLHFANDAFVIEPLDGVIWPRSSIEATVSFFPKTAGPHQEVLYCQISGRESRLPLVLRGEGVGPKLHFSFDLLEIEDVYIGSTHTYQVVLENVGDIDGAYRFEPADSVHGRCFTFSSPTGTVPVGGKEVIQITFRPESLGDFYEAFSWHVQGAPTALRLLARGRVVGPTFDFNVQKLAFGRVSYGFPARQVFSIINTCEIPMRFSLRVVMSSATRPSSSWSVATHDQNTDSLAPEITTMPSTAVIPARGCVLVAVQLTGRAIQEFVGEIHVDVVDVSTSARILPIHAFVDVPNVGISHDLVDFGRCYLGVDYPQLVQLLNDTDLYGRVDFEQDPDLHEITISPPSTILDPSSFRNIELAFKPQRLGEWSSTVHFSVRGTESQRRPILLRGIGQGPDVAISTQQIKWGRIPVLVETVVDVRLTNKCVIDAEFACQWHDEAEHVFQVEPMSGIVPANSYVQLRVRAYLDDSVLFKNLLHVFITNGAQFTVDVQAKGFGSTITFPRDLEAIHFGDVFSNRECERSFVIRNEGRRTQFLFWSANDQLYTTKASSLATPSVFKITPHRFTLKPGAVQTVTVAGFSSAARAVIESVACQGTIEGDPTRREILRAQVQAVFVDPLILFEPAVVSMDLLHVTEDVPVDLARNLVVTNNTNLPLTMKFKCSDPWYLDCDQARLDGGQAMDLVVQLKSSFFADRVSREERGKVVIQYAEHPQRTALELVSIVTFPNLVLSTTAIDMGSAPLYGSTIRHLTLRNEGRCPAQFSWGLYATTHLLDIVPRQGWLQPGEQVLVEVSHHGLIEGAYSVLAFVEAIGGPRYECCITGVVAETNCEVVPQSLSLAAPSHLQVLDTDLTFVNRSRSPAQFRLILLPDSPLFNSVLIAPHQGVIAPKSKERIKVRACPLVPGVVTGQFFVKFNDSKAVPVPVKIESSCLQLDVDARMLLRVTPEVLYRRVVIPPDLRPPNSIGSPFLGALLRQMQSTQLHRQGQKTVLQQLTSSAICSYLLDFGKVLRNDHQERTLTLRLPLSATSSVGFTLGIAALQGSPFTALVEKAKTFKVTREDPVEVKIALNTEAVALDQCFNVVLPLHLVGGPSYNLTLRASVTDPALEATPKELTFGQVLCGTRMTMTVTLSNEKGVVCKWSAGTKKKKTVADQIWEMIPDAGVLKPGESTKVAVRFTPTAAKPFRHTFQITMEGSREPLSLPVHGVGHLLKLECDPDSAVFQSINPFSDGAEVKVTFRNTNAVPIEVFSLDFDEQFKNEAAHLKDVVGQHGTKVCYVPVTGAGEGIDMARLVEQIAGVPEPDANALASPAPEDAVAPSGCERNGGNMAVIFHGAPLSGCTELAQDLARQYGVVQLNLDEVFSRFTTNGSPEHAALVAKVADLAAQGAVVAAAAHTQESEGEEMGLTEGEMETIFKLRLAREVGNALVVDGLETKYCRNPASVLRSLVLALLDSRHTTVYLAHVKVDAATVYAREMEKKRTTLSEEIRALPEAPAIADDAYENLTQEERDSFDAKVTAVKRTRKAFFAAKEKERRQYDAEVTLRLGEKKSEDERNKRKDKKKKVQPAAPLQPQLSQTPGPQLQSQQLGLPGSVNQQPGQPALAPSTTPNPSGGSQVVGPNAPGTGQPATSAMPLNAQAVSGNSERSMSSLSSREIKSVPPPPVVVLPVIRSAGGTRTDPVAAVDGTDVPPELLLTEATFRQWEAYVATCESVAITFRELERHAAKTNAAPAALPTTEKKRKGGAANAPAPSTMAAPAAAPVVPTLTTGEGHPGVLDTDSHLGSDDLVRLNLLDLDSSDAAAAFARSIGAIVRPEPVVQEAGPTGDETTVEQVVDPQWWLTNLVPPPSPTVFVLGGDWSEVAEQQQKEQQVKETTSTKKGKKVQEEIREEPEEARKVATRWIIPTNETKTIVLRFNTTEVGKYAGSLRFAIPGSPTVHALTCSGSCQFASFLSDPRKMFPRIKRVPEGDMSGHFCLSTNRYDYGPLPLNRQRSEKDKYPENRLTMSISNPSHQELKLTMGLLADKSDVFLLDSSTVDVKAFANINFTVYCWPKSAGKVEDTLVMCVKDNPEPVLFKLAAAGYKPEIEVDKKVVSFDKLLVGKPDTREVKVRNPVCIPLNLRVIGLDALGEEVSVTPAETVIAPLQEQVFSIEFKSYKPTVFKKVVKLEYADKLSGFMGTENVTITAEAYDVAVDVALPKGSADTLDFGTVRVLEESKSAISLKNRGKYEVSFKVLCERDEYNAYFSVIPSSGVVAPSDKPLQIQVMFTSKQPVSFRDQLALRCLALDSTTGQIMYSVPIKVNARSVLSRYALLPARDLNFGALVHGTKGSRSFTIENTGEFEFRYSVVKLSDRTPFISSAAERPLVPKHLKGKKSSAGRNTPPPMGSTQPLNAAGPPTPSFKGAQGKKEGVKPSELSSVFGCFVVTPASGVIAPGIKATINVEFNPDHPDVFDEVLGIDISDRSADEFSEPIEYRFLAESCPPGINTTDLASIFEEQTICKRLDNMMLEKVYAEDERTLYFGTLIAGQESSTRIKLSNPFKVASEVVLSVKSKTKNKEELPFSVEPDAVTIPSHESRYVTLRFHPTAIQMYSATFEAVVSNSNLDLPSRALVFDLRGDGSLPRITSERSAIRFKRLLPGQTETQYLALRNDGVLPAKFCLEWASADPQVTSDVVGRYIDLMSQQTMSVPITFTAARVAKLDLELRLKVVENSYENTSIQVFAECYEDEVVIEGLDESLSGETDRKSSTSSVSGSGASYLQFGDCLIGQKVIRTLRLSNRTQQWLRFSWSGPAMIAFSPTMFTLPPAGDRSVTLAFEAPSPVSLKQQPIVCKYQPTAKPAAGLKDQDDAAVSATDSTEKARERTILVSAVADWSTYNCSCQAIHFKKTMMYQSRVFRFQVHNTGAVRLDYVFDEADSDFLLVSPMAGSIPANEFSTISVKFTPRDEGVYEGSLALRFANIAPTSKQASVLDIAVTGSSLRPFCHFDLASSENAADHGNGDKTLDAGTRMLEFSSCGIRARNTKRFFILNPTHLDWRFEWTAARPTEPSPFTCLTPSGQVMSGKRHEIAFEYFPESIATSESTWYFNIPNYNIRVPFLLLGHAIEPNVFLDKPTVTFKPVLVGRKLKETIRIINSENTAFQFQFQSNDSLKKSPGGAMDAVLSDSQAFEYSPASGMVPARGEAIVEVAFLPKLERHFSTQISCLIKRKVVPLTLHLRGEGYRVSASMTTDTTDGHTVDFVSKSVATLRSADAPSSPAQQQPQNIIDLGRIQVGETKVKKVVLHNHGRYLFDYGWRLQDKQFSVQPELGTVGPGESVECSIRFMSPAPCPVNLIPLTCRVTNGPDFALHMMGQCVYPLLDVSPAALDMGPCFVWKSGAHQGGPSQQQQQQRVVTVKNNDTMSLSLDLTLSSPTAFQILETTIKTIAPRESIQFTVVFSPREAVEFKEHLAIEVNGVSKIKVPLRGVGCEFRVQLVRPEQRHINFGSLRPGQSVGRAIKVVNRSLVDTRLVIGPRLALDALAKKGLVVSPNAVEIKGKQIATIHLDFTPTARVSPFSEELWMEGGGQTIPLTIVSGLALGVDMRLESEMVPFGPVALGSSTTKKVTMSNVGDLGVFFKWDKQALLPEFTITPHEGYIAPGMDLPLEVCFQPVLVNPDIRKEAIECRIEGLKDPLLLTLTGICIPQPSHLDTIRFSTPVRTPEVKSVTLTNKTSFKWVIRPVIDQPVWKGADVIVVEPGTSGAYDVTFSPTEMSSDYTGSLFFPLADGSGLLYRLVGSADKPSPSGTITREIACKRSHVETLTVTNWLKRPQRFRVSLDQQKPEPFVILKGHEFMDLPGGATREYKLHFYSFKETSSCSVRVTFKNETTNEYLYYLLTFKVVAPGVMGTLTLQTMVRQSVIRQILIQNPLTVPATFTSHCTASDVNLHHGFALAPQSEGDFALEYLPLSPRESTCVKLVLNSPELGTFVYDLVQQATAPNPERTTHFKATLGNQHTQTIRFTHFCKTKTEFQCKLEHPDFTVDKSIIAAPIPAAMPLINTSSNTGASSGALVPTAGAELSLDVVFEPSKLGDAQALLTLTSATGGDYVFPLHGLCSAPRPQGPITIRNGASTSIPFKNVLNQSAQFTLSVDNPNFTVKASETIAAKKTVSIAVMYRANTTAGNADSKERDRVGSTLSVLNRSAAGAATAAAAATAGGASPGTAGAASAAVPKQGKLTISHSSGVSWVYYLKGTM
ncbi:hypothetical protein GGF32_000634 [Allomyces javanicus]|nr:hypothetical protein GGF32_000634 [Allomyces javanicus]